MAEITIVNRGSDLPRVARLLDRVGVENHLAPGLIADLQVVLDEVLSNVVNYAYPDYAERSIYISMRVLDNEFEVTIEDSGAPFDPLASQPPDLSLPLPERRVGGLGILFVRALMDEVTYCRIGERNRLVLRKHFVI